MRDRRMVEIRARAGSLYIYTHWDGQSLPDIVNAAVQAAAPRWDDEPYCCRILVDQITKSGRDMETGWGLMLTPNAEDSYNHDQPSIIVDLVRGETTIRDHDNEIVNRWTNQAVWGVNGSRVKA